MDQRLLAAVLVSWASGLAAARHLDARRSGAQQLSLEPVALVQGQVSLHGDRSLEGGWSDDLGSRGRSARARPAAANASSAERGGQGPFARAFVLAIDPQKYERASMRLEAQGLGVHTEPFWGYNGSSKKELNESMQVLRRYNLTAKLNPYVTNFLLCVHMAPGTHPDVLRQLSVLGEDAFSAPRGRNLDELLERDDKNGHHCVPKSVAIAASHLRLWEAIASSSTGADEEDPWNLILEDDAMFCDGWRERIEAELPLLPADAGVVKLHWFGHWRKEDKLPDAPDGTPSPFLRAHDPMNFKDIAGATTWEVMSGMPLKNVSIAPFYISTQAYMVKRSSARALLRDIVGLGFVDIDVLMSQCTAVKNYVWRRVLTRDAPKGEGGAGLARMTPWCSEEPGKDWW